MWYQHRFYSCPWGCRLTALQRMLWPMPLKKSGMVFSPSTRTRHKVRSLVWRSLYCLRMRFIGVDPMVSWAIIVCTEQSSFFQCGDQCPYGRVGVSDKVTEPIGPPLAQVCVCVCVCVCERHYYIEVLYKLVLSTVDTQ